MIHNWKIELCHVRFIGESNMEKAEDLAFLLYKRKEKLGLPAQPLLCKKTEESVSAFLEIIS